MSGFALNKENDLYFTNGKLAFINGTNTDQEILQRIRVRLRFFQGEWYLNINHGIPYLNNILGTKQININIIDNFFRDAILDVEGVASIIDSVIDFKAAQRELSYTFTAVSINNTRINDTLVSIG